MNSTPLDDSLTSIQWLCQLESNKLMQKDGAESGKNSELQVKAEIQPNQIIHENPYPKPHYSYATLIVFAINSSREKRMTLQEIYSWIEENYPFYKFAKKGWKNSIRHNLSLHKFFIKEKRPSVLHGKGSYWRISADGKENLMRDLLKQSQNNLQPPCATLHHDPNRKLRPIMPKPNCDLDAAKVSYIPLLTCNLPVVFVPSTATVSRIAESCAVTETPKDASTTVLPATACKKATSSSVHEVVISSTHDTKPNVSAESSKARNESRVKSSKKQSLQVTLSAHSDVQSEVTGSNVHKDGQCSAGNNHSGINSPAPSKQLPNILRRKRKAQPNSPVVRMKVKTPTKSTTQPTLAAINSNHHVACSPQKNFDDYLNVTEMTSSPLGKNSLFDIFSNGFSSPGFSPLRSPVRFGPVTGFTPLRQETDSAIMVTPVKEVFGDLSFNWTPLKTGLTPLMLSPPRYEKASSVTSQGCRKSLGLEKINEVDGCGESNTAW